MFSSNVCYIHANKKVIDLEDFRKYQDFVYWNYQSLQKENFKKILEIGGLGQILEKRDNFSFSNPDLADKINALIIECVIEKLFPKK